MATKRRRRGSQPGVRNPFIKKQDLLSEIQSIVNDRDMSQVEVADEPDQRGDDPSPIRTIDGIYSRIGIYCHLAKIPEEGPDIRCE